MEDETKHSMLNGQRQFSNPNYEAHRKNGTTKNKYENTRFEFAPLPNSKRDNTRRNQKLCHACIIVFLLLILIAGITALVLMALHITKIGSEHDKSHKKIEQSLQVNGLIYIVNYNYTDDYKNILSEKSKQLSAALVQQVDTSDSFAELGQDISHITVNHIRQGSVILDVTFYFIVLYPMSELQHRLTTAFQDSLTISLPSSTYLGGLQVAMDKTSFTAVRYNGSCSTSENPTPAVTVADTTTAPQVIVTQKPVMCEPVSLHICQSDRIPYDHTAFPNYFNHTSQVEAGAMIGMLQYFLMSGCYPYLQQFVCSLLVPKCQHNMTTPPCRESCQDFVKTCGSSMPDSFMSIDCDGFPPEASGVCVPAPALPAMGVRLLPDSGPPGAHVMSGAVQLEYMPNHWVAVCAHSWEDVDGDVICRQLNFSNVKTTYKKPDTTGLMTFIYGVRCMGMEHNIGDCEIIKTGDVPAPCNEPAWLECENQPPELRDVKVALTGGAEANIGLLEVYRGGVWGTVCDDLFDSNDASVACFTMGFDGNGAEIINSSKYATDEIDILLDDLECSGDELHIASCKHRAWGEHNCIHKEDVALKCKVLV